MTATDNTLPTVVQVLDRGMWSGRPSDHITLDYDGRHRRRIVLTGDHGVRFLLDLPQSRLLTDGCLLTLSDGRLVEVIARLEPLLEVKADDGAALLRLAWHIGNRHLAAQVGDETILIRQDHVIEAMLRGLGATVRPIEAAFDPESGAYGGAHQGHSHDSSHHSHGHDH